MTKRKVCVVTGTRAEYGLLYLFFGYNYESMQKEKNYD